MPVTQRRLMVCMGGLQPFEPWHPETVACCNNRVMWLLKQRGFCLLRSPAVGCLLWLTASKSDLLCPFIIQQFTSGANFKSRRRRRRRRMM